ncbi:MAG: BREX-1 system adenine-specific DNA-methyltransferase PglX [Oscillospiraceae bacterium]|nr:BREX-1 system adenine-specific DNA-methyltransferase PglX [Oscillospiraceae bacterium]
MDKTAIKNFAIWARNKLIADISYKAGLLGITDKEIHQPVQVAQGVEFYSIEKKANLRPEVKGREIEQRKRLVDKIEEKTKQSDYATAYKAVIEEVAYTWFNRLIAIRFMEVNEYIRVRVLSSVTAKSEPDIVTTPFESELNFTEQERRSILDFKKHNKLDELFRLLFIKQCNALNDSLPELFERTDDYTELLLNISFTDNDGVVWHLINDVTEDNFKETVEIIGWLYQYYNTEPKDETFALLKNNVKITKERIPAATQLFTPYWIVQYMVENSLGRLWLEGHPNNELKANWKYYLDEAEQTPEVQAQLDMIFAERQGISPEDITFIDPCMGSGHILVYAFDVFMQIYESAGYSQRDAARLILEKNIHGLDIDKRAYQLAYFSLMMKARQYNRRILDGSVAPQVYHPAGFPDGEEYGSLMRINALEKMPEYDDFRIGSGFATYEEQLREWNFRHLLSQKYDVVVTNPPYMGGKGQSAKLTKFLADNYVDVKSDTFSAFIARCCEMTNPTGYIGMFTPYVWMFIQSYEKLRNMIYSNRSITSLIQFEYSAFEEATVPVCSFVFCNNHMPTVGQYIRLVDFRGGMEIQRQKYLESIANPQCGFRYSADSTNFAKIPGNPVAYWLGEKLFKAIDEALKVSDIAIPKQGSTLGDNDLFLRLWYEVTANPMKWFKCVKGGEYRKWYGNYMHLVDWEDNGKRVKSSGRATIRSEKKLFEKGITWSNITSGNPSFRIMEDGFFFESSGTVCFAKDEILLYLLGFLNTNISRVLANAINPTLHLQSGDVARFPVIEEQSSLINSTVEKNISLSRADWDSFETSWDFKRHPLV